MQETWKNIISEYQKLEKELQEPMELVKMQKLSRKISHMQEAYYKIREFEKNVKIISDNQDLLKDEELAELATAEIEQANEQNKQLEQEITELLFPKNPDDRKDVIIEVRAGTGGEEACLFASEIATMYIRYAENKKLSVEILNKNEKESGGIKEIVFAIRGDGAYGFFRFESGVHRVQRVPKTESKGRLHTSACTVFAYPEHEENELEIPEADIRFETFRSSGPGGQSVNTTDSAVRLTHIPTGITVSCQDEKSQLKNRNKARGILVSRVIEDKKEKEMQAQGAERRGKIGSGDRSEKIRTWNFPQDRLTDHRISKNFFGLKDFLAGNLDKLFESLRLAKEQEDQGDK